MNPPVVESDAKAAARPIALGRFTILVLPALIALALLHYREPESAWATAVGYSTAVAWFTGSVVRNAQRDDADVRRFWATAFGVVAYLHWFVCARATLTALF